MQKNSPEYQAMLKEIVLKYKKSLMLGEFMFKNNLECIDCTVDDAADIKGEAKKFKEAASAMRVALREILSDIKKVSIHADRLSEPKS